MRENVKVDPKLDIRPCEWALILVMLLTHVRSGFYLVSLEPLSVLYPDEC
jgi:hypothetical protein